MDHCDHDPAFTGDRSFNIQTDFQVTDPDHESAKALAKGDFDVRFEGKDYREVAELSDTLNATAKELGKMSPCGGN